MRLGAFVWSGGLCYPALVGVQIAENDCNALDLSLSVVVAGFYSIQACNKIYKC